MDNDPPHDLKLEMEKTTVFTSNEEEKCVYRIPALVYGTDEKVLLAFAEKRKTEDDAHSLALVMKRGTVNKDGTSVNVTFEEPEIELVKKADHGDRPMNPCPVYEKSSKTLFLFFIFVEGDVSDDGDKSVIYCNARTAGGYRVEAVSQDGGNEFKPLVSAEKLVETSGGCQGSVVSFPPPIKGQDQKPKWLLYSHPTDKCRKDLGVYLNESPHDSTTWSKPWIINRGPSGYSDLVYIDDGWFACLMECGEKIETEQIALKVFSYDDIKKHIKE